MDVSPAFLEHSLKHMQTVIQTSRRLDSLLHEAAQNLNFYQIFKIKNQNQKPIAVDVLLKAYPMVPLSCRSNLAVRYFKYTTIYSLLPVFLQNFYIPHLFSFEFAFFVSLGFSLIYYFCHKT